MLPLDENVGAKPPVMLVTHDGQWVLAGSSEFLQALGDPNPDYDSVAFAVKNLGFVSFHVLDHSLIEIELHPRNVELPALLAVQQQVLTSQARLFRIKYFDTEWRSEISASAEQVIARLSELCAPVFMPPVTERFQVEPQDFSAIFDDESNSVRPLAQKWRVSFGHFDPSIISLAVRHQLLGRMMIIGVKRHDPDPVWRFIGEGHKWMGGRYQFNGIGEKVQDMPDKEYGQWVNEFYRSVAISGEPRYDFVSARLQYENEDGRPRRLIRYERLLLPWKTPSGEVFVTMCSKVADPSDSPKSSGIMLDSSVLKNLAKSS